MANDAYRAPKGTHDILPPESIGWYRVMSHAIMSFMRGGYQLIETPIFEHTEVFERGVGEGSEVVTKQMYTFKDRAGRSLTLRPEGTAPVVRAVLEHGLDRGPLPVKLAYGGPYFRQERPQKGRYRQFWQVGIEAIGGDDPLIDAEVIEVGMRFLRDVGVNARLLLNSIGHLDESCRRGYLKILGEWLADHREQLAPEDGARLETNPLRTFDSKEPRTIEVMQNAPLITAYLCDACRKHFDDVQSLLRELNVDFSLEPRLVRGLDYYTRTAFEFVAGDLGSQNAVGGGGRYDGLSEILGGPPLPGIGFALGVDRILISSGNEMGKGGVEPEAYVVALGERAYVEAFKLVTEVRAAGFGAEFDQMRRSMKGQMKDADRTGALFVFILGDDELDKGEVTIKELSTGQQVTVGRDDVVHYLQDAAIPARERKLASL